MVAMSPSVTREPVSLERTSIFANSSASGCSTTATCPPPGGAVDPVHDYNRSGGRCSVTGGFVYRGVLNPGFDGEYFFADWCSRDLYSLRPDGGGGAALIVPH